jgi:hypothetical protein
MLALKKNLKEKRKSSSFELKAPFLKMAANSNKELCRD